MHAAALTLAAYVRRLSVTCVTTRAQYFRRAWSTPLCADGPDLCTCSSALQSGSPLLKCCVALLCKVLLICETWTYSRAQGGLGDAPYQEAERGSRRVLRAALHRADYLHGAAVLPALLPVAADGAELGLLCHVPGLVRSEVGALAAARVCRVLSELAVAVLWLGLFVCLCSAMIYLRTHCATVAAVCSVQRSRQHSVLH